MTERPQTGSDITQEVKRRYQAVLQTDVVVGLLSHADGFLQREVRLLTEHSTSTELYDFLLGRVHARRSYSLVSEATVQARQVERGVAKTPPITFVSVTLPLVSRQDEPVKAVKEAVSGQEDVLHPQAVQVVQVMLRREHSTGEGHEDTPGRLWQADRGRTDSRPRRSRG